MKSVSLSLILILLLLSAETRAQATFGLDGIIRLAKENSLTAQQAENRRENLYWYYRTVMSNYRPQLSLRGTLPDFNRSIDPIQQPDGTSEFRERSLAVSDINLSLTQNITATGAEVFIGSELQRIDVLAGPIGTTYAAYPLSVGFVQPIFRFNRLKWDKKIEPLRFEESVKQYSEELERVAQQASERFFDLLLAQVSLEIAEKNRANNDTIYKIAEGRYELGKIAENELIQLELNLLNSQQQVSRAQLDLETARLNLNTFIGNPGNSPLQLVEPAQTPDFEVDPTLAVEQAKANRQQYLSFKRRRLEAERDAAQARQESGLNINLSGSFGLTNQANEFAGVYGSLQDQQRFRLAFQIPVLDWGRQQARIKSSLANQELVENTVAQEEINFEQEIYVLARQLPILRQQLVASKKADELGQKRYDISQNRYLVAKISITDLNIALQEKDKAKRDYLQSLRDFWNAYYTLRMLTLYDFEQNTKIMYE